MVLHKVVATVGENSTDFCPLVPDPVLLSKKEVLFFFGEGLCVQSGVELIEPPKFKSIYLYRHCFPVLPEMLNSWEMIRATRAHWVIFLFCTISSKALSSFGVHEFFYIIII